MTTNLIDKELVLPLPAQLAAPRHARSTILLGSLASLREAGHFDNYLRALEPQHRQALLEVVAGVWVPMDAALAHYRACDALGLSADAAFELGRGTFKRTSGTLLGTAVRMAKGAGVTPWTIIPTFQRFWDRGYDGGGIRVVRIGPKEVLVDVVKVNLLESRYYRNALRGLLTGLVELFCTKCYIHERTVAKPEMNIAVRMQWA